MKTCSKCKEIKPLDDFGNLKSTKDGKARRCKECNNAYARRGYWKDPDAAREKQNLHRDNNPEMHRRISARHAAKVAQRQKMLVSALLKLQALGYTEVEGQTISEVLEEINK